MAVGCRFEGKQMVACYAPQVSEVLVESEVVYALFDIGSLVVGYV